MGLADEFTVEMAQDIMQTGDAAELLAALTGQNAFVRRLPDGVTYRFHHMMKECALRVFLTLPQERRNDCRRRFGAWYEQHRQYLHAMQAYYQSGDYHALLRVVQQDAGILLSSLDPKNVLDFLDECPEDTLKAHPAALLVLMRSMFNWRNIPRMLALRQLLLTAIDEDTQRSAEERGNLLGECDLIMSFLCYNDISAMSRLHRSASAKMSRPAVSIQSSGGWTFGSPSVLMMFYRAPGELESELAEMDECMPHYYKITGSHGQGAETIMHAEAAFMQGRFTDAHIALERAYAQIEGNGQENMALCCDFLARRLSLFTDIGQRAKLESGANGCSRITMSRGSTSGTRPQPIIMPCSAARTASPRPTAATGCSPSARSRRAGHDRDDREPGLSRAGRIRPRDRPQRGSADAVRGDALCAGRAAHPHPDRGGLRNARQARRGARAAREGARGRRAGRLCAPVRGELPLS